MSLAIPEQSALDQARHGLMQSAILPAGMDANYLAPADEEDDLAGIHVSNPMIGINYKYGTFVNRSTKQEPELAPRSIAGVALARTESRLAFSPQQKDHREKIVQVGLPELSKVEFDKAKWICQTDNLRKTRPSLNPSLTPAQKSEAVKAGVGHDCASCPLARWHEDSTGKKFTICKTATNLLWLDSELQEPVVLNSLSGPSNKILNNFLAAHMKKGRSQLSIYSYQLKFSTEKIKRDGNEYYQLVPEVGAESSPEELAVYRQLRAGLLDMLDARVGEMADNMDPLESEEAPAHNKVDADLVELSETGEMLF